MELWLRADEMQKEFEYYKDYIGPKGATINVRFFEDGEEINITDVCLEFVKEESKDDFEPRTCENCKYSINDNWVCDAGIGRPSKDFGCNGFERREDG